MEPHRSESEPTPDPLGTVPLAGADHANALAYLQAAYAETRRAWRPRMVNLTAETGVGKTRIVQEFYREWAAGDPYWPRTLTGSPDSKATNPRKVIIPTKQRWDGVPRSFWLGLSCWMAKDGSPGRVLEGELTKQLQAHASSLLMRQQRARAARDLVVSTALAFAPFLNVEIVKAIVERLEQLRAAREAVRAVEEAAASDDRTDETLIRAVMALANLINDDRGQSMVVVIDDAHDADELTLTATQRLLEGPRGVLVIATSWPTAVNRQALDGRGFGNWLESARITHTVESRQVKLLRRGEIADLAREAAMRRQREPIDPDGALILADRAAGNPMLLVHLMELMWAYSMTLETRYLDDLAELPSTPERIFAEVWHRFLPRDVRETLKVAALLETPILEAVLQGAALAVDASDESVTRGLVWGWLAPVADPYSDDRSIRFADPFRRELAEGYIKEFVTRTRESIVVLAGVATLLLPPHTAEYSRMVALETLTRVLERYPGAARYPVAAELFFQLGSLLSQRDPARAADLFDKAIQCQRNHGNSVDKEVLIAASSARLQLRQVDRALSVLNIGGPALGAIKVDLLLGSGSWKDVLDVAEEAFRTELAHPGSVLPAVEASVVEELADAVAIAGRARTGESLQSRALGLLVGVARDLRVASRIGEAREVARKAAECDPLDPRLGRLLDELGLELGVIDPGGLDPMSIIRQARRFGDEGRLGESMKGLSALGVLYEPSDEAARLANMLLKDAERCVDAARFDEAADALRALSASAHSAKALPIARKLLESAGDEYASLIAVVALDAGDLVLAVKAAEAAVDHLTWQGAPPDASDVQAARCNLVEALACAGDGARATAVATASLQVAERSGGPSDQIRDAP